MNEYTLSGIYDLAQTPSGEITSSSLTLFTKKCSVLYCAVEMKAINEKKGIFSFYSHNVNKKISVWFHFHYNGLIVSINSVNNQ